jgi:hypothetical protein
LVLFFRIQFVTQLSKFGSDLVFAPHRSLPRFRIIPRLGASTRHQKKAAAPAKGSGHKV